MRLYTLTLVTLLCLALAPAAEPRSGGGPKTMFEGAGQRLHFSFGGKLTFRQNSEKLTGKFAIVAHPLAPASTRLVVSCGFGEFSNATLTGPRLEFDAKGKCKVLELDGDTEKIEVQNRIIIVEVPDGNDQIDVEFIGSSGIMIPGGQLAFGNFTVTTS